MIYINELLNLKLFDDFKLIAGESGIKNQMSNIVILEYESIKNTYNVFNEGDFVLSSLFFAKDNPSLIEEALMKLMHRKVSGIAIKTVFFHDIPSSVKAMADRLHIPIFIFSNAYMEDLIICANELLKSKLLYLVYEEKITNLIENKISSLEVLDIAHSINPEFYPNIITAYFTPKKSKNSNEIIHYFQRLLYNRYKSQNNMNYSYVKYRQGMMLIYSFNEAPKNIKNTVSELLKSIDLLPNNFYIGISDTIYEKNNFNVSMKQAIYSNRVCQLKKDSCTCYSEIGIYQMIAPLLENETIKESYNKNLKLLKDYDKKFTSNLLDTLIMYVNCNGEIAKTAKGLFQHPNTIRYRIKKVCVLLSLEEESSYNYIYILVKLYILDKNSII